MKYLLINIDIITIARMSDIRFRTVIHWLVTNTKNRINSSINADLRTGRARLTEADIREAILSKIYNDINQHSIPHYLPYNTTTELIMDRWLEGDAHACPAVSRQVLEMWAIHSVILTVKEISHVRPLDADLWSPDGLDSYWKHVIKSGHSRAVIKSLAVKTNVFTADVANYVSTINHD